LEDGRRIVVIKTGLIKTHSLVAQRVIHVDQGFPILMSERIQQSNKLRHRRADLS
jgi:hypothetical protein